MENSNQFEEIQSGETSYRIEEYTDTNSGNVCELFQVLQEGVLVYERDYGSVGSGEIVEYIEDYVEFVKK